MECNLCKKESGNVSTIWIYYRRQVNLLGPNSRPFTVMDLPLDSPEIREAVYNCAGSVDYSTIKDFESYQKTKLVNFSLIGAAPRKI